MNNLRCHAGRTFTLGEIDIQTQAEREDTTSKRAEALEDAEKHDDVGLEAF
jgi:hypothetical protein